MNIPLRKIFNILLATAITAAFVYSANFAQGKLNDIRSDRKLTDTDYLENAPPALAFTTVALGAFRGLVADILWLRSSMLEDKGQYFETMQLSSWIVRLQPRFTGAISYLAWNMAYNISVTCSQFEDRWRWVQNGIELIRDEGLVYNPGDPVLYKELGWIYQHKIGSFMDDANNYYKNRLALEMMDVFGGPEPDWERLAAAPSDRKELNERLGENAGLLEILEKEAYAKPEDLYSDFRENRFRLPDSIINAGSAYKKQLTVLDDFLRKKALVEIYKLRPEIIAEIIAEYGKLDFRLPEAHAVYWATLGIRNDRNGKVSVDCERMITQSLRSALQAGKLLVLDDENLASILTIPNLDMSEAVIKRHKQAIARQKNPDTFEGGFENFLKDLVVLHYTYGQVDSAKKYYSQLAEEHPSNPRYKVKLIDFVEKEWIDTIEFASPEEAMDIIGGIITRVCFFLASKEHEAAKRHEELAKLAYLHYKRKSSKGVAYNPWVRLKLPEFSVIEKSVRDYFLMNMPKQIADRLREEIGSLQDEDKNNTNSEKHRQNQ